MPSKGTKKLAVFSRRETPRADQQQRHTTQIARTGRQDLILDGTVISECLCAEKQASPCRDPVFLRDLDTLTAMQLREKYSREANAHRNMKNRRKTEGAIVHPAFEDWQSFLRLVGPMPARKTTLDRINNDDPEYAPGKVAWGDKRTQNSNKGDTLVFRDPATGKTYKTSQLAKRHGVTQGAIRKQLQRGWTDEEIIAGHKLDNVQSALDDTPIAPRRRFAHPTIGEIEHTWKEAHAECLPGYIVLAFSGKQRGLVSEFADRCPTDKAVAIAETCVRRWAAFCKIAKYDEAAYGIPDKPTVEFLHRYAQTAVNFALPIIEREIAELNFYDEPTPPVSDHQAQNFVQLIATTSTFNVSPTPAADKVIPADHEDLRCPPDEFAQTCPDCFPPPGSPEYEKVCERFDASFTKEWPKRRSRIDFDRVAPYYQALIRRIDPDFARLAEHVTAHLCN
ncbi:hypothetical protein CCR94_11325 [Rhodoblastus sphagnicola]|uniref:Uncharacterized protein n=1 Tax=Rhodoblastus sphagnicola TaxID=333368 RepID=A0A2S6N857_9HYPH|nr:hypothetical protein [Rhodoblastus sphagnicola]MBB4201059.1 hypothetical protein [Rhodoblastus sphagnicola]PPQ30796.1 hypothetical protein CCR94_11325 [Rhodoblastus sphagnicola]